MNTMTPYQFEKLTQSFCKLRGTCGLQNELDIHGMYWNERVVCKVIMYDRTNGLLHVENSNGIKWLTDLKSMEFCLEDGSKVPS